LRISHFLSQIHHESNGLKVLEENLNYSASALISTFSRHRISIDDCKKYGRTTNKRADQQMIANIVYGGPWGLKNLGNTDFGDGWKYKGRGPLQCTGKSNYKSFSDYTGIDFVEKPELLLDLKHGLEFACFYWNKKGLNQLCKDDSYATCKKITIKINGGTLGIESRYQLFQQYIKNNNISKLLK
jgi:putative chitinase